MSKTLKVVEKYWWIFLLVLLIPSAWALFVPGFYGASDDLHVAWLYEMGRSLSMGQFPPRFVPDLSFGFGYPLFNFVFPLPFYIGQIFHWLGMSLVDSIKAVFFISLPLSALSMYFLLRQFGGRWLSLVGALIYVYTPYRAVDIYIRGAIGEILSFVFFPLVTLVIFKLEDKNYLKWIGIGGLSLGGLILSHDIASFMYFPFLILLILIKWFIERKRDFIIRSVWMVLLGLLVSCYFWLPALMDSSLMQYSTVFDFVNYFPHVKQLVIPYWGYGGSMSFNIGTVNILLVVVGVITLLWNWKKFKVGHQIILIWAAMSFLVAVFMMNNRSAFLWFHLPYLPFFQFPWRFLMMTTFLTPLFLVSLEKLKRMEIYLLVLLLGVLILNSGDFRPQDFLGRQDSYYINRYVPYPTASNDYRLTKEEYLRLPKSTQVRPNQNYPLVQTKPDLPMDITGNELNSSIQLLAPTEVMLSFNKYFFPGWVATLDNHEINVQPGKPFGQLWVNVPAGMHSLNIKFTETPFKQTLDGLSLAGVILAIYLWTRKNLAGK